MRKPLIKPWALNRGDAIGIAAPASPFDPETFNAGVRVLESLGFEVKVPEGIFKKQGYHAGTEAQRAALLMELFQDDSLRGIMCARGGFGSMKLLPLLDFETIARHPKVLIGFSDISALLLAVLCKSGMVTFHGPLVTTLARGSERTVSVLFQAVSSSEPMVMKASEPVELCAGRASGPVLGGNLTTLVHLTGTPYAPALKGCLLFLEDRGEAPYRIDRMMSHLYLSGHLDGVRGVILGSFQDCGSLPEVYSVVSQVFGDRPVPILGGMDLGHGKDNMTIPLGLEATLDTAQGTLQFKDCAVYDVTT
ncbi:MAG: LD-carboxypeptidase [Deltaproteobacteria bacterium]|nr:LD-carboxypeptidase [Deltaproteobacteria bacterium]